MKLNEPTYSFLDGTHQAAGNIP